jgi:hypothetical protein
MSFTDSEDGFGTDAEGPYGNENFGEPPSNEAFGYPPYRDRPHPIPTDPVNLIGQPPYFENVSLLTEYYHRYIEPLGEYIDQFMNRLMPQPPPPVRDPQTGLIVGSENYSIDRQQGLYDEIEMDFETGRLYRNTPSGPEYLNDGTIPLPKPNPQNYTPGDVPPFSLPDRNGPTLQEMLDAIGQPIDYQPIFDPGTPLPPPSGGLPPGPWSGIPGVFGGGPLFGLGVFASPYIAMTAWAWAWEHPLPPIDNNPYPITPMNPLFGNPEFSPIAPLPGLQVMPDQAGYEPDGSPSYQTAPPIQALSTAPSFTDTSPNLMAEIVGVM